MWSPIIAILCILTVISSARSDEEKVFRVASSDSYLEAYKAVHGDSANALLDEAVKKTDREFDTGGYPYPNPQPQYGPPYPQGEPQGYNYGPPRPQYGSPNPQPAYGPPAPAYGPPAPAYGPPSAPPVYGPPSSVYNPASSVQVFYGVPHAMLTFWDKLKYKLDLFTIGKILLKLVIFKKIVAFIAIICLLLFIPALKHKGGSDVTDGSSVEDMTDMIMRHLNEVGSTDYDDKLNNLAAYVTGAIESFTKANGGRASCDSIYCRTHKVLKTLDEAMSYERLAMLYSKELRA